MTITFAPIGPERREIIIEPVPEHVPASPVPTRQPEKVGA
jgi:hypothetical protein